MMKEKFTLDELNQVTLEVSAVLTKHGVPGYEYNEPMNWLRKCLADALKIIPVETPLLAPQSWFGIPRPTAPSRYRSIDDDWRPLENISERPEPGNY